MFQITSKRKRQELDWERRFEVVMFKQEIPLVRVKLYSNFIVGKPKFKAFCCIKTSIKQLRAAQHEDIDNALLKWLRKARSKNVPITGPMLQEKAIKIGEILKIPPEKLHS